MTENTNGWYRAATAPSRTWLYLSTDVDPGDGSNAPPLVGFRRGTNERWIVPGRKPGELFYWEGPEIKYWRRTHESPTGRLWQIPQ